MAVLVAQRTNRPELGDIAGRIKASQSDEIEFMQSWLTDRGRELAAWPCPLSIRPCGTMEPCISPEGWPVPSRWRS